MIRRLAKDSLIWLLWYPLRWTVSRMPIRLVPRLGRLLGSLACTLSRGKREMMLAELGRIGYGGAAGPPIVREAFALHFMNELEVFLYRRFDTEVMEMITEIEGMVNLDAALERGRGAILLIGHFGQNQMIMPAFGYRGYRMNQISARPVVWKEIMGKSATPMMARSFELRWRLEESLPVNHIDVFGFLRPAFRCLRRNEVLGLAIDGGGGKRKAAFPFLGREALFSLEPLALAAKTGAAVLPTFVLRERNGRHRIVVHEPMSLRETGDPEGDVMANTRAFVGLLDGYVRRHPAHYLNFIVFRKLRGGFDDTYLFVE